MKLKFVSICLSMIILIGCGKEQESFVEIYDVSDTLFSIGGERDQDNKYMIPRSALVDSNKNVYILDARENNIKVLDRNGKYKHSISSVGKGPNELSHPVEMHFNNKQDIVIYDLELERFSRFSLNGNHIENIAFNKWVTKFDIDENNNFYIEVMDRRMDNNDMYMISKLYKYDSSLKSKILIDSTEQKKSKIITEPIRMIIPIPFSPEFLWKLNKDGTVLSMITDSCNIKIFNKGSVIRKSILNEEYRVKVNNIDKENLLKDLVLATGEGSSKMPESISSQLKYPKFKPYVANIGLFDNNFLIQTNYEKGIKTLYYIIDSSSNLVSSTLLLSKVFNNMKLEFDGFIYSSIYHGDGIYIFSKYSYNKK